MVKHVTLGVHQWPKAGRRAVVHVARPVAWPAARGHAPGDYGQCRMEAIISHDQLYMNDASSHGIARLLADNLASTAFTPPLQQRAEPSSGSVAHAGILHPPLSGYVRRHPR